LLEQLVVDCLNKDVADRPKSMTEVIRVLQEDWAHDLVPNRR
jgi:hypothetical protein